MGHGLSHIWRSEVDMGTGSRGLCGKGYGYINLYNRNKKNE